jgi:hypothetical protein
MYVQGVRYTEVTRGNTEVPSGKKAKWEGEGGCYEVVLSLQTSQR